MKSEEARKVVVFDRTVPRETFFRVKRRLTIIGYKVLWVEVHRPEDLRSLPEGSVLVTFSKHVYRMASPVMKTVLVSRAGKRSINKLIAEIFGGRQVEGLHRDPRMLDEQI